MENKNNNNNSKYTISSEQEITYLLDILDKIDPNNKIFKNEKEQLKNLKKNKSK